MKTIDRYVVREMSGPFAFGVLAFVLLFVSANVLFKLTELINQLGISLWTASKLFMLWLPGFIVYTFPLAILVAILVAFGRMSGDSELVAMYAGGISFRRLVVPMIVAGFVVSLTTAAFNEFIVPACNRRADDMVRQATLHAGKQVEQGVFLKQMVDDKVVRLVYADRLDVENGEMIRPTIVWFDKGRPIAITVAEYGRWQEKQGSWLFTEGTVRSLRPDELVSTAFDNHLIDFHISPTQIARETRNPSGMTYEELKQYIGYVLSQRRPTRQLEVMLHQKFAIPFASLVFALIAPPLGVRSHRGSSAIGLGIAILIGFGYYVIANYMSVVAQQGQLSALWAAWLPNILTGAIGVGLILKGRK
jgi:lipopolysaccharide export system permease protein